MSHSAPNRGVWAQPHLSIDNLTSGWMSWQGSPTSATAWGTQYRAIYVPVRVPSRCIVRKLGYACNSTATGDIDFGLYDANGVLLVSTGTVAKAATGTLVVVDVTDTTIGPGLYYLAMNNSTTTDTFTVIDYAAPLPLAVGLRTETLGSVTLPATATWVADQALGFIPTLSALLVTEVS